MGLFASALSHGKENYANQRRRIVMEAPVKMEANAPTRETTFAVNVKMDLQELSVK